MADYLSFVDEVLISDPVLSDSDEEFNVAGLSLDEEEPEVRFNDPSVVSEDLVTAPRSDSEASRKYPRDDALDEEELIEASGLFAKRPCIPGCPDIKRWLMKNELLPAFKIRISGITLLNPYTSHRTCISGLNMARMTCRMLF